jgi:hypothetical protein
MKFIKKEKNLEVTEQQDEMLRWHWGSAQGLGHQLWNRLGS